MGATVLTRKKMAAAFATLILAGCLFAMPAGADRGDGARLFIENLSGQAIHSLTSTGISRAERIRRFRTIFDQNFAAESIGRWVLGRHWQRAEPAEQAEYLKLFSDYIVASYVDRFAAYSGETVRVTKLRAEDNQSITVFSEILTPESGKTPVHVDWRIEGADPHFKIVDLVVEGVSMSFTMRADFGSFVQRDGGRISGLLAILREKTATLRATD